MKVRQDYWRNRKRVHEWGVVAQARNPYREFWRCDHCGKYCECGDFTTLWTPTEFEQLAATLNLYYADSDIRWGKAVSAASPAVTQVASAALGARSDLTT